MIIMVSSMVTVFGCSNETYKGARKSGYNKTPTHHSLKNNKSHEKAYKNRQYDNQRFNVGN